QESLFFNPFSGVALYRDSGEFKRSFQVASRELLVSAVLEELYWLSDRERRMQNLARWAAILFLIGLIPYLLTMFAMAARIL
ncbi:MAG: hypothetical protein ACM3PY_20830, partial [Omnitrophica WOR_2 bacterium]